LIRITRSKNENIASSASEIERAKKLLK